MQSFASPTHTNPPPHKNHALQIKHHKFMPHPHKKGATIAYTYALSTQKSIERAQLSEHGKIIRDNLCSFVTD